MAIESAGVTLLRGDLAGLVRGAAAVAGEWATSARTWPSPSLYNVAGVPIAAGVLYPAFDILLSPKIGAAAMALSSVSVIANALRLARVKLDKSGMG